jgi:hypothetical protein
MGVNIFLFIFGSAGGIVIFPWMVQGSAWFRSIQASATIDICG